MQAHSPRLMPRRVPCPSPAQIETLEVMLAPMAKAGADPLGSMGNDAPLAHMRCGAKVTPALRLRHRRMRARGLPPPRDLLAPAPAARCAASAPS